MEAYQPDLPADRWERIRDFVLDAAATAAPQCVYTERRLLYVLSGYIDWAHNLTGRPLAASLLFRREIIDLYVANNGSHLAEGSRRNYRAVLLRAAEALLPDANPAPMKALNARATYPPYYPRELALLRVWASAQPSEYSERQATLLLSLAAGAGLRAREIGGLRLEDIDVDSSGVLITVAVADPVRQVPMLAEWERPFQWAIESGTATAPGDYVFGRKSRTNYPNIVNAFVAGSRRVPDAPLPQSNRLRNTWLITHLAAKTDLRALMRAAGIAKFENLARLLAHIPELDSDDYRAALRQEGRA